jgi:phosphonate metabolism-associated iron-containing alcohol dehydrogenase
VTGEWSYFSPVHIVCATGASVRLGDHVAFARMVLVTSPGFTRRGLVGRIGEALGERLVCIVDDVKPNPDLIDIDRQAEGIRGVQPDAIVGLGGGSSIDTAKALARLLAQPPGVTLAQHFRDGLPLGNAPALPVVAIPTTAGTGAEVTPFGTVWDFERAKKYSVAGDDMYPAATILDPQLTLGLPRDVTISSGLDAISHAFESTWNRNANPVTLSLAMKSLQLSLPALPRLTDDPYDLQARRAMMEASLLAGLAISQTRTALAHSISYPLTARFDLPHGIACSFTLPALLRFNAEADDGRLADLARALGFKHIEEMAAGLESVFHKLEFAASFRACLPNDGQVLELLDEMVAPGRAENNLKKAGPEEISSIVRAALENM